MSNQMFSYILAAMYSNIRLVIGVGFIHELELGPSVVDGVPILGDCKVKSNPRGRPNLKR